MSHALICIVLIMAPLLAQGEETPSFFSGPKDPNDDPENTFFFSLASLVVPGAAQAWDGQYQAAAGYFTTGFSGYLLGEHYRRRVETYQKTFDYQMLSNEERENQANHGLDERRAALGYQLQFAAGSFSAYHSFRTRVLSWQKKGAYGFIKHEETPFDIMMAPFDFSHFKSPDTYIPMLVVTGISLLHLSSLGDEYVTDPLTGSDLFFSSANSFLAGTHEEVLFRGWIQPTLHELLDNGVYANWTSSVLFALAHLQTVSFPIVQLVLGWHLGNMALKHDYGLAEAVFLHTWWDVVAFTTQFQYKKRVPTAKINPTLWLPPLEMVF